MVCALRFPITLWIMLLWQSITRVSGKAAPSHTQHPLRPDAFGTPNRTFCTQKVNTPSSRAATMPFVIIISGQSQNP